MAHSDVGFKKIYVQNTGVATNPIFSASKLRLLTDQRLQESEEKPAMQQTPGAETEFVAWL